MGKGDMKTKRGKINKGSYGKHRPHKEKSEAAVSAKAATDKKSK